MNWTRYRQLAPWSLMLLITSCTHAMHVNNLNQYSKTASASRKLTIVIEDRSGNPDEHEYFTFIQEALATHPDVRQVAVAHWDEPAEVTPDIIVKVHPEAHYDGSGWNYLITFPGFLIFTHAWNGFVYQADIVTGIEVSLRRVSPTRTRIYERHTICGTAISRAVRSPHQVGTHRDGEASI